MSPSDIAKARAVLACIYGAAFIATLDDHKVALLIMGALRHPHGPASNDARGHVTTKEHRHA